MSDHYSHRPLNEAQALFLREIAMNDVEVERPDSGEPFKLNGVSCNAFSISYLISAGALIIVKIKETVQRNKPPLSIRANKDHPLIKSSMYIGEWITIEGYDGAYRCVGIGYREFSEEVLLRIDRQKAKWIDAHLVTGVIS